MEVIPLIPIHGSWSVESLLSVSSKLRPAYFAYGVPAKSTSKDPASKNTNKITYAKKYIELQTKVIHKRKFSVVFCVLVQ